MAVKRAFQIVECMRFLAIHENSRKCFAPACMPVFRRTISRLYRCKVAMAGLLSVFSEFKRDIPRERVRAGPGPCPAQRKRLGRPMTAGLHTAKIRKLHRAGISQSEIARRLQIGRTVIRRTLARPISAKMSPSPAVVSLVVGVGGLADHLAETATRLWMCLG